MVVTTALVAGFIMLTFTLWGLGLLICIVGDELGVTQEGSGPHVTTPDRCGFGLPD